MTQQDYLIAELQEENVSLKSLNSELMAAKTLLANEVEIYKRAERQQKELTGNLAKEQQVRAALRNQRNHIFEFLKDETKSPNNKQDHINLAYMLGTIHALYEAIRQKPPGDLEQAVKVWESK